MSSSMCKLVYAPLLLFLVPILINHHNVGAIADRIEPTKLIDDLSPSIPPMGEEETATYLVQHLSNNEEALIVKMSELKSEAPDANWKAILTSCITSHVQAHKELDQALASLKKHDFLLANKHVADALKGDLECHKGIDKGKGGFCKTISGAITVHEKLCDQAIRYLGSLHHQQRLLLLQKP